MLENELSELAYTYVSEVQRDVIIREKEAKYECTLALRAADHGSTAFLIGRKLPMPCIGVLPTNLYRHPGSARLDWIPPNNLGDAYVSTYETLIIISIIEKICSKGCGFLCAFLTGGISIINAFCVAYSRSRRLNFITTGLTGTTPWESSKGRSTD